RRGTRRRARGRRPGGLRDATSRREGRAAPLAAWASLLRDVVTGAALGHLALARQARRDGVQGVGPRHAHLARGLRDRDPWVVGDELEKAIGLGVPTTASASRRLGGRLATSRPSRRSTRARRRSAGARRRSRTTSLTRPASRRRGRSVCGRAFQRAQRGDDLIALGIEL